MRRRLAAGMAVCAVLAVLLQRQVDLARAEYLAEQEERPFVPPLPGVVKLLSLGYENLMADMYWIETIQYYENCWDHKRFPKDLYAMTNFITDLDPNYCLAYFYGSLHLIENYGDQDEIIALLIKGSREDACPGYWRDPYLLGYYYAFELKDFESAAPWMRKTCELQPQAKKLYCGLASRMEAIRGEPEVGIELLREMKTANEDPDAILYFNNRIEQLQAKIVERDLTAGVKSYEQRHGSAPADLADIFRDGPVVGAAPAGYKTQMYRAVPPHPLENHRFVYDREADVVCSDPPVELKPKLNPKMERNRKPAEKKDE
jgi:hypothetical protein